MENTYQVGKDGHFSDIFSGYVGICDKFPKKTIFTNTNANSHLVIIVFDELESARQEKV